MQNHFYLTATFTDTITLGKGERNETTLYPIGNIDNANLTYSNFLISCFTENGEFIWANQIYGAGGFPSDLQSDDKGTTYMVGGVKDNTIIRSGINNKIDTLHASGVSDIFITRFKPYYNYQPFFSVVGNNNVLEDFVDSLSFSLVLDSIPVNESGQEITFTLDSVSGNIVNYSFDLSNNLKVSSISDLNGEQIFYFSADDGAIDNYSASNTLVLSVTPVNDKPVITGLVSDLSVDEDNQLELSVNDFVIEDPDNDFPDDFTLLIEEIENYTYVAPYLTPSLNFSGVVQVSSTVYDGIDLSESFLFNVTINPVNDIPIITGVVDTLATNKNIPITILLDYFMVEDPDNDFPSDFSLNILEGENYTSNGVELSPNTDFVGDLSVAVTLNDGIDNSEIAYLPIEVKQTVGINSNFESMFSVTPNPFINELCISTININCGIVDIYDLSGALIYTKHINNQPILKLNLSDLSKGVYFLKFTSETKSSIKKIIKE